MITDVNETIKQLLIQRGALDPSEVDIKFETPDREWSTSISKPTVNVYLYDVRENHRLRSTEWIVTKDENGIATRKKNPNRIDIAYVITVWANDVVDEHNLLWHVLRTLFRYPELPEEVLSGQLVGQPYPIKAVAAQPDGLFNNWADFWAALENKVKPSINYVITLPLDTDVAFTAPEVRTKIIDVKPPDAAAERMVQVAGMVYEAGNPTQGLAEAKVIAKEARMTTTTDDQGHYAFSRLAMGEHTFQVLVAGKKVKEKTVTIPSDSYNLEV